MNRCFIFCVLFVAVWGYVPVKSPSFRIANGKVAEHKQFPYQARLEVIQVDNGVIFMSLCGGALISESTILTAAHCLEKAVSAIIYLGVTKNVKDNTRVIRLSRSNLNHFKPHEHYNRTTLENDIALIKLTPPVQFNDGVQIINLPKDNKANLDNRMAVIAGFGKTAENSPTSNELLYANRKILPGKYCSIFQVFFKPEKNLCIDGSENISACSGDSGGPLVVEESDGSKSVVGIVSFGLLACDKGYPGVFTKVSYFLDWIKANMF